MREKSGESREVKNITKHAREAENGEGRWKGTRMEREISSFSRCALRDILVVSSRRVSTLISEILNVHLHHRGRRATETHSLSSLVSFYIVSLTNDNTPECTRVFTRVFVRLRLQTILAQHRPPMYHLTRC